MEECISGRSPQSRAAWARSASRGARRAAASMGRFPSGRSQHRPERLRTSDTTVRWGVEERLTGATPPRRAGDRRKARPWRASRRRCGRTKRGAGQAGKAPGVRSLSPAALTVAEVGAGTGAGKQEPERDAAWRAEARPTTLSASDKHRPPSPKRRHSNFSAPIIRPVIRPAAAHSGRGPIPFNQIPLARCMNLTSGPLPRLLPARPASNDVSSIAYDAVLARCLHWQ